MCWKLSVEWVKACKQWTWRTISWILSLFFQSLIFCHTTFDCTSVSPSVSYYCVYVHTFCAIWTLENYCRLHQLRGLMRKLGLYYCTTRSPWAAVLSMCPELPQVPFMCFIQSFWGIYITPCRKLECLLGPHCGDSIVSCVCCPALLTLHLRLLLPTQGSSETTQ